MVTRRPLEDVVARVRRSCAHTSSAGCWTTDVSDTARPFAWLWPLLAAAGSGGLLALGFEPYAFAPLAWVALVPWLMVLPRLTPGRVWLYGTLLGLIYLRVGLDWLLTLAGTDWGRSHHRPGDLDRPVLSRGPAVDGPVGTDRHALGGPPRLDRPGGPALRGSGPAPLRLPGPGLFPGSLARRSPFGEPGGRLRPLPGHRSLQRRSGLRPAREKTSVMDSIGSAGRWRGGRDPDCSTGP